MKRAKSKAKAKSLALSFHIDNKGELRQLARKTSSLIFKHADKIQGLMSIHNKAVKIAEFKQAARVMEKRIDKEIRSFNKNLAASFASKGRSDEKSKKLRKKATPKNVSKRGA